LGKKRKLIPTGCGEELSHRQNNIIKTNGYLRFLFGLTICRIHEESWMIKEGFSFPKDPVYKWP
jgi:hypothetical protein